LAALPPSTVLAGSTSPTERCTGTHLFSHCESLTAHGAVHGTQYWTVLYVVQYCTWHDCTGPYCIRTFYWTKPHMGLLTISSAYPRSHGAK
jgi:hypothetical protein